MRLIDADALKKDWSMADKCEECPQNARKCQYEQDFTRMDICQMLDDAPTIGGWISVKDRLPGKYEPFYAACKSLTDDRENWVIEGIYKGMTYGGPWGVPMIEMGKAEVYAWMPKELPEPPKEDDNESD